MKKKYGIKVDILSCVATTVDISHLEISALNAPASLNTTRIHAHIPNNGHEKVDA